MSIQLNLEALIESRGLKQVSFAKQIGASQPAVSTWLNGTRRPGDSVIQRICDVYKLTRDDIVSERYGLYAKMHGLAPDGIQPVGTSAMVPLLGCTHMGEPSDEYESDREVEVPASVVEAHPGCFCVHADGDCMDNRFPDDSVLLVDSRMRPYNGCAVLAETADYQSVVRVYNRGASTLMLSADSHTGEYDDIIVRPEDPPVTLKGVVVWYQAEEDLRR